MATLAFDVKEVPLPNDGQGMAVALTGSIDASTNQQFEKELTDILTRGTKRVMLLLHGVKYINSTGLGTIVKCVDTFRGAAGDIKLVGVPTKVIALFEMLGLLPLFETFDNLEDAQASFGKAQEAPQPVQQFPVALKCSSCGAGLSIPSEGKYRCPRCGECYAASSNGSVKAYQIRKPRVVEVKLPSNIPFAPGLKALVEGALTGLDGAGSVRDGVMQAVDEAASVLTTQAGTPGEAFTAVVVADEKQISIGFVNYGGLLSLGQDHMALQVMRKVMDKVEVVNLPKGHLLKLTKALH